MDVANLNDLIRELRQAFDQDQVDVDHVMQLMKAYKSNPADWKKFAAFDRYRYTRNLVDEGNGKYNLMLLCWGEGQGSAVHDHADSHCFMKVLDGKLRETRFQWPEDNQDPLEPKVSEMQTISKAVMDKNAVLYINDSLGLHRVENPSHTDGAISLHLYVPPFEECHVFDQRTGRKTRCKTTFWSKYGERVSHITVPRSCVSSKMSASEAEPIAKQQMLK